MADRIEPLTVSLAEFRRILERRAKASLEIAGRSTTPRFGQASRDEASFFSGLQLLVEELDRARTFIHGDPSRPVIDSDAPCGGPNAGELSAARVNRLLGELQAPPDEHVPLVAALR